MLLFNYKVAWRNEDVGFETPFKLQEDDADWPECSGQDLKAIPDFDYYVIIVSRLLRNYWCCLTSK